MPERETVDDMPEEQEHQELDGADDQAGEQLPAQYDGRSDRGDRETPARSPHLLITQAKGHTEDEIEQDEHHTEAGDVLLQGRDLHPSPGDVALLQLQEFFAEGVPERSGFAVGEQHDDLDRLQL